MVDIVGYKIQPAEAKDAVALTQASVAAKAHWGYPQTWLELWRNELTITTDYIAQHKVFKATVGEEIIGFCALETYKDAFEIGHLYVIPEFMGQGIGKKLLHIAMEGIPQGAIVRLVADPNAKPFYQRNGFVVVGQTESKPKGRYLPVMEKIVA